jgi:hypothetical protein
MSLRATGDVTEMNYRDMVAMMRGGSPVQEASPVQETGSAIQDPTLRPGHNNLSWQQVEQLRQLQQQSGLSHEQLKALIEQVMGGGQR